MSINNRFLLVFYQPQPNSCQHLAPQITGSATVVLRSLQTISGYVPAVPGSLSGKKSQFKLLGGLHILSRCLFNGTYFDFQKFTGHRRDVIDFALGAKLKRLFDLQFALLDEFDRNVIIIVYENAKCCTCFFFSFF